MTTLLKDSVAVVGLEDRTSDGSVQVGVSLLKTSNVGCFQYES
jgi:hypothetical protein